MPLGSHRQITVYDRVLVGSDGFPSALYAVERAHEVAAAAEARMVVVTAYHPGGGELSQGKKLAVACWCMARTRLGRPCAERCRI